MSVTGTAMRLSARYGWLACIHVLLKLFHFNHTEAQYRYKIKIHVYNISGTDELSLKKQKDFRVSSVSVLMDVSLFYINAFG